MTAPIYIKRNLNVVDRYEAPKVRAVRFIENYPQSHWHVNCGHPRIQLLRNLYWVQTRTGAVQVGNGQWVVLHETDGLSVVADEDFNATYEPLSDYE